MEAVPALGSVTAIPDQVRSAYIREGVSSRGWSASITQATRRVLEAVTGQVQWCRRRVAPSDLAMLEITTDPNTDTNAWGQTLQLAHQCGLAVHDAAYLELALRRLSPIDGQQSRTNYRRDRATEAYNLAAQSHVQVSFEAAEYTGNADAIRTLRLLEAIRILGLEKQARSRVGFVS
jgi:hypothetical protein